jgi:glycosyltransferase involved in cell wall biosynthesis
MTADNVPFRIQLTPESALPETREGPVPAYHEWLERQVEIRRARYPRLPTPGQFTAITAVWNTSPDLLQECAASILEQEGGHDVEWILIDNGSTTAPTLELLERLAKAPQVRVLRLPRNLGIFRALRIGLESATGRYVLPVDHDDVLVRDCFRVLASVIHEEGDPAFVFSDEDLLIEGQPRHPYLRPDFDPILNLASSYIWHVTAVRRDVALASNLYLDIEAEFCQDWDATMRIWQAGYPLLHVPEVLYHWRQHPASSTGKADPAEGSIRSVRHVLERFVAAQSHPEHYRIDDFPMFRGARELYVFRNEFGAEPTDLLIVGPDPARVKALLDSVLASWHFPLREICVWSDAAMTEPVIEAFHGVLTAAAQRAGISTTPRLFNACELSVVVDAMQSSMCTVMSQGVMARGPSAPWEALKHFELFRDVVAMGGRGRRRCRRGSARGWLDALRIRGPRSGQRRHVRDGAEAADPRPAFPRRVFRAPRFPRGMRGFRRGLAQRRRYRRGGVATRACREDARRHESPHRVLDAGWRESAKARVARPGARCAAAARPPRFRDGLRDNSRTIPIRSRNWPASSALSIGKRQTRGRSSRSIVPTCLRRSKCASPSPRNTSSPPCRRRRSSRARFPRGPGPSSPSVSTSRCPTARMSCSSWATTTPA